MKRCRLKKSKIQCNGIVIEPAMECAASGEWVKRNDIIEELDKILNLHSFHDKEQSKMLTDGISELIADLEEDEQ